MAWPMTFVHHGLTLPVSFVDHDLTWPS